MNKGRGNADLTSQQTATLPPRVRPPAASALGVATGVPGADGTDDDLPDAVETSSSAVAAPAAQDASATVSDMTKLPVRCALTQTNQKLQMAQTPTPQHDCASE